MDSDYLKLANSWIMWVAVLPPVLLTFLQAGLFVRKALRDGKKMGITSAQFKAGAGAATISAVGPSMVIAIGCLALITTVGGPMAWMRLSYVGAVNYELTTANFAAIASGAVLGGEGMTVAVFACCCWVMCIGCMGWLIVSALFTDKMGKLTDLISGGNMTRVSLISAGGCLGAYTYMVTDRLYRGTGEVIAVLSAVVIQSAISLYEKKTQKAWCKKWGMTISMFASMAIAGLIAGGGT